jgi:protein gp37
VKKKKTRFFNTAYAIGKKGKPFSDYMLMIEVQQMNVFFKFDNYKNIPACSTFLHSIAYVLRVSAKAQLRNINFVSILADGSTDSAVIEQEIVYIRYIFK